MIKTFINRGIVGVVAIVTSLIGFSGIAAAASINTTGPGSYNVISSSNGGGGTIYNTGPDSTNIIRSSWNNGENSWNDNWCNMNSSWNQNNMCEKSCKMHNQSWNWNKTTHKCEWMAIPVIHHNNECQRSNNHINQPGVVEGVHNDRGNTTTNNNIVSVSNFSSQTAHTGNATVSHNTNGGNASSGDASNVNTTNIGANISNGTMGGNWHASSPVNNASISNTGPDSHNIISGGSGGSHSIKTTNNNNLNISNSNYQTASTGNATVYGNTNGGSAISGNASNDNATSVSVSINN